MADLEVEIQETGSALDTTFFDSGLQLGSPNTLTFAHSPGSITLLGTYGGITVTTLAVKANYAGSTVSPGPGTLPAYATDTALTASGVAGDKFLVTVTATPYLVPPGDPVRLSSSEASSAMTSAGDESDFTSSLTSGLSTTTTTTAKLMGPIFTSTSAASPDKVAPNPAHSFTLSNELDLKFSVTADQINVNASTFVNAVTPEPATLGTAFAGILFTFGFEWTRRRRHA